MYECLNVYIYICMYVCMHVGMYVCMYVCMYLCRWTVKDPTRLEMALKLQVFLPFKGGRLCWCLTWSSIRRADVWTQAGYHASHLREANGSYSCDPEDFLGLSGSASLSLHADVHGQDPRPHTSVPPPSRQSHAGGTGTLRSPPSAHQLRGLAADRRLFADRENESRAPGQRTEQTPLKVVRALLIPTAYTSKKSNHCYAIATLQAIHWLCSFLPASQAKWTSAMRPVMQRMSQQARIPDLWTKLSWALAHSGWQQPHRQHDVAECLSFFRRFLLPYLTCGGWQRRLLQDAPPAPRCEVTDCGETWYLFTSTRIPQLQTDDTSTVPVQRLISAWHNEAANGVVALSEAPILLAIQLNRCSFRAGPDGRLSPAPEAVKDSTSINHS